MTGVWERSPRNSQGGLRWTFEEGRRCTMKFKAVIKKSGDWWIGWLVDLPGVNAQEKTREELIESLKLGAEDMLKVLSEVKEEELVTVEVGE